MSDENVQVDETTVTVPAGDDTADTAPNDTALHMVPKGRLDEEVQKRRAVETELDTLARELVTDIPEHLQPLVPKGLTPSQTIAWYRQGRTAGLFQPKTEVPQTDTTPPRTMPTDPDYSTMPPEMKMAAAYRRK